jgi:hypothetical protein
MGEVGMRPVEFWSMTLEEIDIACKGYETRLAREQELTRVMATILRNVNRAKGIPSVTPMQFYPLYTDKFIKKAPLITKEELDDFDNLIANVVWQNKN